jgi:hypothetical protein
MPYNKHCIFSPLQVIKKPDKGSTKVRLFLGQLACLLTGTLHSEPTAAVQGTPT